MDGVIAANTTIGREGLNRSQSERSLATEAGGLSGAPLRHLSTEMVRKIVARTQGKLPVIGVGGVASARDAEEKLDAGACLVQVYTGLIYEGPALVSGFCRIWNKRVTALCLLCGVYFSLFFSALSAVLRGASFPAPFSLTLRGGSGKISPHCNRVIFTRRPHCVVVSTWPFQG